MTRLLTKAQINSQKKQEIYLSSHKLGLKIMSGFKATRTSLTVKRRLTGNLPAREAQNTDKIDSNKEISSLRVTAAVVRIEKTLLAKVVTYYVRMKIPNCRKPLEEVAQSTFLGLNLETRVLQTITTKSLN